MADKVIVIDGKLEITRVTPDVVTIMTKEEVVAKLGEVRVVVTRLIIKLTEAKVTVNEFYDSHAEALVEIDKWKSYLALLGDD